MIILHKKPPKHCNLDGFSNIDEQFLVYSLLIRNGNNALPVSAFLRCCLQPVYANLHR